MAGKSINELPEITSVSDSSLMALSEDGKTLGRVAARTLKNSVVGQHISNYIRYINQDIKLELNDGTLTLKAGSKVYNGDGTIYTNASDIAATPSWGTGSGIFVFPLMSGSSIVGFDAIAPSLVFSGDTAPTFPGNYAYWFDTTTKKVKYTKDGGSSWTENRSLPLCLVTSSDGIVTAINQVFNGFGYIGSTVFALPGTVVSMPNGKEENGVLKNTEVEITSVRTVTLGSAGTTDYICYLSPTGIDYMLATNYYESAIPPTNKNGYAMWLNTQDNHFYVKNFSVSGSEWELVDALGNICKFTTSSGKITKFESKSVLSLLDTNTFNLVPHIVETWTSGTSWYRVWSDGWCEQGGRAALNEVSTTTISLFKVYKDTNYNVSAISITASTAGDSEAGLQCTPIASNQITLTAHYLNPNNQTACWETKGYIS